MMQIYNYNSTIFTAKKASTKNLKKVLKSDTLANNQDDLYFDIEKYLKKDITKEEYFKIFKEKVKNNPNISNNRIENKYINDMLTTLDLVGNTKNIPDKYLIQNMEFLLNYKKK